MKPVDLIYKIVYRFVPMNSADYAKSYEEGSNWWGKIRTDKEAPETQEIDGRKVPAILVKYKRFSETWYGMLAHAVGYLILVKLIANWLISTPERYEEEEL